MNQACHSQADIHLFGLDSSLACRYQLKCPGAEQFSFHFACFLVCEPLFLDGFCMHSLSLPSQCVTVQASFLHAYTWIFYLQMIIGRIPTRITLFWANIWDGFEWQTSILLGYKTLTLASRFSISADVGSLFWKVSIQSLDALYERALLQLQAFGFFRPGCATISLCCSRAYLVSSSFNTMQKTITSLWKTPGTHFIFLSPISKLPPVFSFILLVSDRQTLLTRPGSFHGVVTGQLGTFLLLLTGRMRDVAGQASSNDQSGEFSFSPSHCTHSWSRFSFFRAE